MQFALGSESEPNRRSMSDHQLCIVCSCDASHKCSRCLITYYCSKTCQVASWPSHKIACKQLRNEALIRVERLVFDISCKPPRALLRPSAHAEPIELTAAQLRAPLGRFPYSQQGENVPPEPVIGNFAFGTSVELGKIKTNPKGKMEYIDGDDKFSNGRLNLVGLYSRSDTMFSTSVTIEDWQKAGGGQWCVEDVVQIVLQRFQVHHEDSENGWLWGDKFPDGLWAMKTEGQTPPGRFSLLPHLSYHFSADINHPFSTLCSIV